MAIRFLFQCGELLSTSESDVNRHQILTYKDSPRAKMLRGTINKLGWGLHYCSISSCFIMIVLISLNKVSLIWHLITLKMCSTEYV